MFGENVAFKWLLFTQAVIFMAHHKLPAVKSNGIGFYRARDRRVIQQHMERTSARKEEEKYRPTITPAKVFCKGKGKKKDNFKMY